MCWTCGGSHHESACQKKQGGVNDAGQEHDCNEHALENAGGFNLGGGEADQGGWSTINENYSLGYEPIKGSFTKLEKMGSGIQSHSPVIQVQ